VLLNKKVVLVLNKRDLLNDEEILKEYKKTLFSELNKFLKEKKY
jgi:ribosome biogenesis GTPase A